MERSFITPLLLVPEPVAATKGSHPTTQSFPHIPHTSLVAIPGGALNRAKPTSVRSCGQTDAPVHDHLTYSSTTSVDPS